MNNLDNVMMVDVDRARTNSLINVKRWVTQELEMRKEKFLEHGVELLNKAIKDKTKKRIYIDDKGKRYTEEDLNKLKWDELVNKDFYFLGEI